MYIPFCLFSHQSFEPFVSFPEIFVLVPYSLSFMYKTRAGRRVLDLDYKVLHSTGAQVKKNRGENTIMEDLKTQSIKICSDIEDFRDSYNLEDITEDYELQQYVNELKSLKQE